MPTGPTIVPNAPESLDGGPPRPTVLVVDDSRFVRATIVRALRGEFELQQAECGERAWELLLLDPSIGVVLSDLTMPGMDGFELLKRVRESVLPRIRLLPFAVLSGADEPTQRKRAAELGADRFVVKGDGFDELNDWIGSRFRAGEAGKSRLVNGSDAAASRRSSDGTLADTDNGSGETATGETSNSEPPTSEPPTIESPTSEPQTNEPPTSEPQTNEPPTSEPQTNEPPTSETPTSATPTSETPTSETPTSARSSESPTSESPTGEAATGETATSQTATSQTATPETASHTADAIEPHPTETEALHASAVPVAAEMDSSVDRQYGAGTVDRRAAKDPLQRWFLHQFAGLAPGSTEPVLIRLHAPNLDDLPSRLRRGVRAADALHQDGPDTAWLFVNAAAPIALKLAFRFGLLAAGRAATEPGSGQAALVSMMPVDAADPTAALTALRAMPPRAPPPGRIAVECAAGAWGADWRFDVPWAAARLLIG